MATPKYARIHLDRFGSDNEKYELWYFLGKFNPDYSNPLFPNITTDIQHPQYPRKKVQFNSQGYVDIPMEQSDVVSFYIKRNDGYFVYNGELCNTEDIADGPTCSFCYETGYIWIVDTNVNPQTEFYIKEGKPYVYRDDTFNKILSFGISTIGPETLDDDETDEESTESDKYRIFYTFKDYKELDIPDESKYELWHGGPEPSEFQVLYLKGKSYENIGEEDMQLSLDATALQAEKDDAIQMLEKAIANSLYKIGEDVADFDETAFLADVDAFKATKADAFGATIDYLESCLNAFNAISS